MKIATKVTYHCYLENVQIQVCTDSGLTEFGGECDTAGYFRVKLWVMKQVISEGFALACVPEEIDRPDNN